MAPIPHVDRIDRREHGATMVVGEELDADSKPGSWFNPRPTSALPQPGQVWLAGPCQVLLARHVGPAGGGAGRSGLRSDIFDTSKSCSMAAGTGYGNSVVSVSGQCNPGHARLRYRRKPASLIALRRQYSEVLAPSLLRRVRR